MRTPVKDRACPNPKCDQYAKTGKGNVVRHSFYRTKNGKRRRFRCKSCGKTSCSNTGTPYIGLQHPRSAFDRVAALSVEGINKSSIARVMGITWNTVARWLERAANAARHFNDRMLRDFELRELQTDEIRAFIGSKSRPIWIFATIEVSSRLWPSTVVGRRSWCQDVYISRPGAGREGDGLRADQVQEGPRFRAFRGGSFNRPAVDARSANRVRSTPEFRSSNLGLRAARALDQ